MDWNASLQTNVSFVQLKDINVTSSSISPLTFVYRPPFQQQDSIACGVVLIVLAVFGVFANLLTIYVTSTSTKLTSIFNYFVLSLSVSDFVSACLSPLFLYRKTWGFGHWRASSFLCKVFWAGDIGTSIATALHIMVFSLLRLITIRWPHKHRLIQNRHAQLCICVIWIIAVFCGSLPFALWTQSKKVDRSKKDRSAIQPSCSVNLKWIQQFKTYSIASYSIFFYVPLVIIAVTAIGTSFTMYTQRKVRITERKNRNVTVINETEENRQRKENQAFLQLLLIVGSFMLGYVPFTAFHLFTSSAPSKGTYQDGVMRWWFGMGEYICMRTSECLNPVFYNLASSVMRTETKAAIKKILFCKTRRSPQQNIRNAPPI